MIATIVEIARHELMIALRSRRAVAVAILYLASALVGSLVYAAAVAFIEKQAIGLLTAQGADPLSAAGALSLAGQQAYQQLVAFFAGVGPDELSTALASSPILPPVLWGSLTFLPFLIVISSYDQLASDIGSRSICYSVVRVPRHAVLLGKLCAQTVLFVAVTVVASLVLFAVASAYLQSLDIAQTALGLGHVWLLLLPYGLCYLGLSAFCSASVRQPSMALFTALGLMVALRLAGWFEAIPIDDPHAPLRYLHWLSPASYLSGLWRAGTGPLVSACAYLAFTAAFVGLAARALAGRDL